jgi:hypothetical protein
LQFFDTFRELVWLRYLSCVVGGKIAFAAARLGSLLSGLLAFAPREKDVDVAANFSVDFHATI